MLRVSETKYDGTMDDLLLYHNYGGNGVNSPVVYGNLLRTNTGTGQDGRIGDSIYASNLRLRMWFQTNTDYTGDLHFRIMIVACPPDQVNTPSPAGFWKQFGPAGVANRLNQEVNTDRYKIVTTEYLTIRRQISTVQIGDRHEINLSLNRKLNYQSDVSGSSAIPKYQRDCLSLVIIPYGPGAVGGAQVANVLLNRLLTYKDF